MGWQIDTNTDGHGNRDEYAITNANQYINEYPDADGDQHTNAQSHANADTHSDHHLDPEHHADGLDHTDAQQHTNVHANTCGERPSSYAG